MPETAARRGCGCSSSRGCWPGPGSARRWPISAPTSSRSRRPEGDETRGWGPPFAADGAAAYFHACNRGKRAIALDFRDAADLALARRLAAAADVVVENFKVGGLARFGLDYASVAAGNPGVVYASVTGFGQDGPLAPRPGYDFIIQAMGGIMDLTGEPDGPPQKPGVAYADLFTGLYGTVAVLAALRLRDRTGRGQWIDLGALRRAARGAGEPGDELPDRRGAAAADGQRPSEHRALPGVRGGGRAAGHRLRQRRPVRAALRGARARAAPRPALPRRNRDRLAHRGALVAALAARIAALPRAEVLAAMEAGGVPAGPINTVAEAFAEPQAVARGMVQEVGGSRGPRSPMRFSDAEIAADRPPPRLDEHGAGDPRGAGGRGGLAGGSAGPERPGDAEQQVAEVHQPGDVEVVGDEAARRRLA